jgi:selenocysteine lyase/cysteine desulfurase
MGKKHFFGYAAVAPISTASYQAVKQFIDEFYTMGPPEVLYKYDPIYLDLADEAAKLLNCGADEITYIKNTTEGIVIASETLPLGEGDEVLVMANEYPANLLPWIKKRKDGVKVKIIGGRNNAKAFDELIAAIGPRTKAISISTAQSYDGYMFNIEMLSKLCRQKEIFLVLDAVQSIGNRKLDLQKTPCDFLVCGGQKYLRAGMGSGLMYVSRRVMPKLKDYKVGIRSMQDFDEQSYSLKPGAERFQDGTQNLSGLVSLTAALRQVNEAGIDKIDARNRELLGQIKKCFKRYQIPFIDHGVNQGNIISMPVSDPQGLFEFLKERNIYIKPMKDVARLSFIHETSIKDIEKAAGLISEWVKSNNKKRIQPEPIAAKPVLSR